MEGKGGVKKPSRLSPVAKCLWGNRAAIVGEKGKRPAGRSRRGRNRLLGRAGAKEKRRTEENRSICLIADCGWDIPFSWVAVWDAAAADEKERKFVKLPSMIHYELMYGSCSIFGSDPLIYAIGGKECTRECPVWENLKRVVCFNARSRCEGWQKSPSLNVPRFDPLILSTHDGTVYAMGSALPGLSFAERLKPGSDKWENLPPVPDEVSKENVSMYAVFNRGRRILLYSLDSRIAFTYDVKRNSWSVLDANFGLWLGDAAVVGDVMFCYGALTKITWAPPSSFHVRAYDLEEKIWLPHHVGGLEDEGVLPPLADRGQPGYISLIRIHSRRLCLIWAKLFRVDGYPKLNVHCTKFSIHRRPGKRKREAQFYASNLSHVQYVLDGWCILRCFLMGSAPPVEEDTIKERRKKKKNEGHDGETSGVERLS